MNKEFESEQEERDHYEGRFMPAVIIIWLLMVGIAAWIALFSFIF